MNKKIVFLTGTRADFGKIKTLIQALEKAPDFTPYVFITGMHLLEKYGYTALEVARCGFTHTKEFANFTCESTMDLTLAKTIEGFSSYVKEIQPDMVVIHGDRVEALAGAIVGSLNNILVGHIEGGELSGTIDELIRHSVSKLSHLHFVSNQEAKTRLLQMGEIPQRIYTIGSPDLDVMFSDTLPDLATAKSYYDIDFASYNIVLFHPVTTEVEKLKQEADDFVTALLASNTNNLVVYPNNDLGSEFILNAYKRLENNPKFRVIPSLRFEYFLTLLKHADGIIGNSSAGVREAPCYGVPTINIGSRQNNRVKNKQIINVPCDSSAITKALKQLKEKNITVAKKQEEFGKGNSYALFMKALQEPGFWDIAKQKQFIDR